MTGKITLKSMAFYGYHGALAEGRIGNRDMILLQGTRFHRLAISPHTRKVKSVDGAPRRRGLFRDEGEAE